MGTSLSDGAVAVLQAAEPAVKAELACDILQRWRAGDITEIGSISPPDRPARPRRPSLVAPRDVPRRRITSGRDGRVALLHALAHIELNAIDLAFDLVARFTTEDMPRGFYDDWLAVGGDEARHFRMLADRLAELDAAYGDLPAHDGLWQAAERTADNLLARLAIVPLVLEARGLDVTPAMAERLRVVGDARSADILRVIHDEEITHVAAGTRWFRYLCERRGLDPAKTWQGLVRDRFAGQIKPPFNDASRALAGLPADFYLPIAGD